MHSDKELYSQLLPLLRKLGASGRNGFEGLVEQSVRSLTGRPFSLSRSGDQHGSDVASETGPIVTFECKRFDDRTAFNERELIGEVFQASRTSRPVELWILVATRDVPTQILDALDSVATDREVTIDAIHTGGRSDLAVLLAADAATTIRFLRADPNLDQGAVTALQSELDLYRTRSDLPERVQTLRERLTSLLVGFAQWAAQTRENALSVLRSPKACWQTLGQRIDLQAPDNLDRVELKASISRWWSSPTAPHLAVTGDEGLGKTWMVLDWLQSNVVSNLGEAAVGTFSAMAADSQNPTALIRTLGREARSCLSDDAWHSRLVRWIEQPGIPRVLLVLDGINERRDPEWWRELLDACATYPSLRLLVTTRTAHWNEEFVGRGLPFETLRVEPLTEAELATLLAKHNRPLDDFQPELREILRRPRYLRLALKLSPRLNDGEISVNRLIFEEWKDREEHRRGTISNRDFNRLLIELAAQATPVMSQASVISALRGVSDAPRELLADMASSGIIDATSDQLRLEPSRLSLGRALFLVDSVRHKKTSSEVDDEVERSLDPMVANDERGRVLEYSCLRALPDPNCPLHVTVSLLRAWASAQNAPGRERAFTLRARIRPEAYFELAEVVWKTEDREDLQRLVHAALLEIVLSGSTDETLGRYCQRWLSFIHPDGRKAWHPQWPNDDESVSSRVGTSFEEGLGVDVDGITLTWTSYAGWLSLGGVALGLMSAQRQNAFQDALRTAYLAEAALRIDRLRDKLTWLVRFNTAYDCALLERLAQSLSFANTRISRLAGRALAFDISHITTLTATADLAKPIPSDLLDPCRSRFPWARRDCARCAETGDRTAYTAARGLKHAWPDYDFRSPAWSSEQRGELLRVIDPGLLWSSDHSSRTEVDFHYDELEPAFCRVSPHELAQLIRELARGIATLPDTHLRSRYWGLRGHEILFSAQEWAAIRQRHQALLATPPTGRADEYVENSLFQLSLQGASSREQVEDLSTRPADREDFTSLEAVFKPIDDWAHFEATLGGRSWVGIYRLLWLAGSTPSVPRELLDRARQWIHHSEGLVRAVALRLLVLRGTDGDLRLVFDSNWRVEPQMLFLERAWGSRAILAAVDGSDQLEHTLVRVDADQHGAIVARRGNREADLRTLIARLLDGLGVVPIIPWARPPRVVRNEPGEPVSVRKLESESRPSRIRSPEDFKEAFDPRAIQARTDRILSQLNEASAKIAEFRDQGRKELLAGPPREVFEAIHTQFPEAIDEWVRIGLGRGTNSDRLLHWYSGFFQDLCGTLLTLRPEQGVALYRRLKESRLTIRLVEANLGVEIIDLWLWRAPSVEVVQAERRAQIDTARSNRDLFEIALSAAAANATRSLVELLEIDSPSSPAFIHARAATVLGFCPHSAEVEAELERLAQRHPTGWVGPIIDDAREWLAADRFARHWRDRFDRVAEDTDAWAAFRLFLRAVDRRYWTWANHTPARSHARTTFLLANQDAISDALAQQENELARELVGHRVLDGMHPWL